MPKHEVTFCQKKICEGKSCRYFDHNCNHKMIRPDPPEPEVKTCPECGHKNPLNAANCEACDYPIKW